MTTKELIDVLFTYPPDQQVVIKLPNYKTLCTGVIGVQPWETSGNDQIVTLLTEYYEN